MTLRRALLAALAALTAATLPSVLARGATVGLPADAVAVNDGLARCTGGADAYVARSLSGGGPSADLPPGSELVTRFVQLSDTHIIDDDGPNLANGTPLEIVLDPAIGNTAATFLNEEFTDEALNAMFQTIDACQGEGGADLALTITTGDITDTNWLNVVRRWIDNADAAPGQPTAFEGACGYATVDANGHPKLGGALGGAGCPIAAELLAVPTGRLATDDADQSARANPGATEAGPPVDDDATYQYGTTRALRQTLDSALSAEAHGSAHIAAGLPDSFTPVGLATPYYAVFGNHDVTVKGTATYQKPFGAALLAYGRYFLESKREYVNEWFATQASPGPVGHGFENVDAARLDNTDNRDDTYYSFVRDGVRFVVVDTTYDGAEQSIHRDGQTNADTAGLVDGDEVTNPLGLEAGYMSRAQFDWLAGQLAGAAADHQPVLVFSHHPDRTFVERQYPWAAPFVQATGAEITELLGRATQGGNPSTVVAWIAGHTHANRVNPCAPGACPIGGGDPAEVTIEHGYWRFETASLINWPQEGRVVELWRLPDGSYALKLTMISPDQSAPAAARSRELSGIEEMCSVYEMRQKMSLDACPSPEMVGVGAATKAGASTDRDVLLLP